ncbi:MAG: GNAT family N-acetyltransferase [Hoeflea sp.]|uniref:GNAT family N-acetyltransferase n=1 Tax=Hoeflea sp. TaxID=1940281 RepID=UPI00272F834F|nr:GNAT family N-acetyltransferase [Hoeflea sp.]MDP2118797.1 GNAT family N-acetyltransferase [Hoeflea sp.]
MMNSAARKAPAMPVVRRAAARDLPACAAIINAYIDATDWLPRTIDKDALEAVFVPALLDSRTIFVAENDGAIEGYLSMDEEAGFIHALYLSPSARGAGLGKALLDAAKHARPQGFELTVFEPNRDAVRFYAREGLVEVPEGRNEATEEGVQTLLMRWPGAAA